MGRKLGPDGPKLQIREINGRQYAYKSTSRMIDGRKKTINECVGRYDPVTETVIPKTPRKPKEQAERIRQEMNPSIDFSKIGCRSYGGPHLLDALQRRMGIGEDLHRSFGLSAKAMMACAMALAINPGPFSSIEATFDSTYLRDLYGIEMPVTSQDMSVFTNNIGKSDMCIDAFFGCRIRRCDGLVAWDTTTNSTYGDMGGEAEWAPNKDGEDLRVVKKAMATDMRGIPMLFRFYPGSLSDMATVDRLQEDIERYGRDDALFVMDRGFCSGANLHEMLVRGRRFVTPAVTGPKAAKTLMTRFNSATDKVTLVYDKHAYTVWKTEVGLVKADRTLASGANAYELVCRQEGDEEFGTDGILTAYVCFDSKKYSDDVQSRDLMIDSLMEYASNMDEADPVRAFKKRAGKAVKYFEIEADGRKVKLEKRKNAHTYSDNRAGLFIMFCSQDVSWELMMAAYDARRLTEQAFDTEKACDRRMRTADKVTLVGRYMIQFISQMLLAEIRAVLREKNSDARYTVEGLLATLSTLDVLEYGGRRGLSEVTRNVRRIMNLFDVEVPSQPLYHAEMFDFTVLLPSEDLKL